MASPPRKLALPPSLHRTGSSGSSGSSSLTLPPSDFLTRRTDIRAARAAIELQGPAGTTAPQSTLNDSPPAEATQATQQTFAIQTISRPLASPIGAPAPPNRVAPLAPPHQPMPNQSPGTRIHSQPPIPGGVPVQGADIASITESEAKKENAHQDVTETPYVSVWDRAVATLRDKKSENLLILEKNLKDLGNRASLADDIGQMLEERHEKIRAKDGVSQSRTRKFFTRGAKFVVATKDLGMGLARLDPHKIAPVVLGGVYCLSQYIVGATEVDLAAIEVTIEIAEIFALWNYLEERQMNKQHNQQLRVLYEELGGAIARMYEVAIVLLGTLMKYFDSKWHKTMSLIVPHPSEWEKLKKDLKAHEAKCNSIQSRITTEKNFQERTSKVLKWISPHDSHKSYKTIQERTKTDGQYRDRCQWVVDTTDFELWYSLKKTTVLWLNGNIGTGKTTSMARAIREIERSSMVEIEAKPFAKFFFEKARSSDSLLSVETCLGSLVRQLSWNHATSSIEPVAERKYNEFQDDLVDDSSLTTGDCLQLLKDLISDKEAYIMIDGIDECNDASTLLEMLKELIILPDECRFLHLMLGGRSSRLVGEYFENFFTITTTSANSLDDQYFFVDTEIDRMKKIKSGSLFVTSKENFPDRLGSILKTKAKGLFRWIEIKIEFFRKHTFRDTREIKEQLDQLETSTKDPELDDEYKKLLDLLSAGQRTRAMSMLKFIACSFWPLSAASLAEAITAHEFGKGNPVVTADDEVTADDVRRLLVGFISEVPTEDFYISKLKRASDDDVLELGHTSVLEYLIRNSTADDDFTELAQHSEAASLCFASISYRQRLDSALNSPSVLLSDDISFEDYRKNMSDLFYYSCENWPEHCRIAFAGNNSKPLIESTCEFILGDSYMTWNCAVRGIQRGIRRGIQREIRSRTQMELNKIWHDPQLRRPGFVIIVYSLTELLEFPKIQAIVNFADVNGIGRDLFTVATMFSERATMRRILQLLPGSVQWNGDYLPLYSVIYSPCPEAVAALLNSRQDAPLYTESINSALLDAYRFLKEIGCLPEERILLVEIIEHLLASGADTSRVNERHPRVIRVLLKTPP